MQPRGRNPMTDMMMLRDSVVKEVDYLASRMRRPPAWPPVPDIDPYRLPVSGDRVVLRAMRRRPELDGSPAQVLSGADAEGFVAVRVFTSAGEAGSLKVHLDHLRPLDPRSEQLGRASSAATASTCSRSSRSRLSSALSASALCTLRENV
mmetsp:Transcript_96973/g.230649  ORF Transcript_96973/g.230649 Transcript_96973/m.230649 type:complete len:150 (+) Transcript_96973:53-502(+)